LTSSLPLFLFGFIITVAHRDVHSVFGEGTGESDPVKPEGTIAYSGDFSPDISSLCGAEASDSFGFLTPFSS